MAAVYVIRSTKTKATYAQFPAADDADAARIAAKSYPIVANADVELVGRAAA